MGGRPIVEDTGRAARWRRPWRCGRPGPRPGRPPRRRAGGAAKPHAPSTRTRTPKPSVSPVATPSTRPDLIAIDSLEPADDADVGIARPADGGCRERGRSGRAWGAERSVPTGSAPGADGRRLSPEGRSNPAPRPPTSESAWALASPWASASGSGSGWESAGGGWPGRRQPVPRARTVTRDPVRGIRIRVQLQLLSVRFSRKFAPGSAISLSRYWPAGRPVTSTHCQAKFQG